jgi:exodeoxyribonuclease III
MSYNLLFGGFDGENGFRHKEQITLINSIKPDILLVQEAKNFDARGSRVVYKTEAQLDSPE